MQRPCDFLQLQRLQLYTAIFSRDKVARRLRVVFLLQFILFLCSCVSFFNHSRFRFYIIQRTLIFLTFYFVHFTDHFHLSSPCAVQFGFEFDTSLINCRNYRALFFFGKHCRAISLKEVLVGSDLNSNSDYHKSIAN